MVLAKQSGYQVEIICFEFDNWSKEINDQLKQQLGNIKVVEIPAGRTPFFAWFSSVASETVLRIVGKFISLPVSALSQAVSRRSNFLINALNKVSKPDWVIGHNPGAMWPCVKAAKKFNCSIGFDVEDYHPGEGNDKYLQGLSKKLMIKLLPKMGYVSFAAPLILEQVKNDLNYSNANWFSLLNYFPSTEFIEPKILDKGPVRMVWFSQNISAGRGLELILPLLKSFNNRVELHLIGHVDDDFYESYLKGISNVIVYAPMTQKDLHHSLAAFDIGLAVDISVDINRNLTITNKLLAYLQSGLYILATDTKAQKSYLEQYSEHGRYFDYKANNAVTVLETIVQEIDNIRYLNRSRYENFKNKNWEQASEQLLKTWNS